MLKKIGVYSVFLVSGLVLGYVFFISNKSALVDTDIPALESVGKWTCPMHLEINGEENGSCPLCKMDLVYMDANENVGKWTCSMHPEVHGEENGSCPLCKMDLVYMDANENVGKWTCSMHPEIDGEENGSCPLCRMDLVYTDAAISEDYSTSQFKMTKEAVALANIETYSVVQNTVQDMSVVLSGTITTNKETDAVQTTIFDGRLEKLYANSIGKRVRVGQEIGLIYSPELYLAQDKLLTSATYKQTHQKLYDAARNTLGLWKMTDQQIDTMLLNGKPIINFPLYADVTGTIVEVLAKKGNYYSQGDPLYKTSDLRTVWAIFDAYENQLDFLRVGQELEMSLLNLKGKRIKAKIAFIDPILDDIKRTVSVRVVVDNRSGLFKPGMLIQATIKEIKTADDNLITIPKSAVLWTGKRSVVYTKPFKHQPIFEMREVELGPLMGDKYQVLDGLDFGDVIVSEGTFTVDAAAQLSGQKSMMSK